MGAGRQVFTPPGIYSEVAKVTDKYLSGLALCMQLRKSRLLRTTLSSPYFEVEK